MKTAFSILQTMTIAPFQNIILNSLDYALTCSGYTDTQLYFEQLTPLVILSQTAEETGKSIAQVEDETNDSMENPATTEDTTDETPLEPIPGKQEGLEKYTLPAHFEKEYEIYKK
jgi:hypothetical protein